VKPAGEEARSAESCGTLPTDPEQRGVDYIDLSGLTFYGYHGALAEEQALGQRFVIDVRLGLRLESAGRHDDLKRTVDYGRVADTVRSVVEGRRFRLIEALAEALARTILDTYALVEQVTVRVAKPSAPISSAPSGLVAVEIVRGRSVGTPAGQSTGASATVEAAPAGSVLRADGIRALLRGEPPLVEPVGDLDAQLQPNGFDVTLESVWQMHGAGAIGVSNDDRLIPGRDPVEPSGGWFVLVPGTYLIRFQEAVALPLDVMAFGRSRSSLLRCGAAIHTAVWDAGYRGRSEALMVVYAESGLRLAQAARVLQLVFVRLEAPTHAYAGAYQGENLPSG
jgi:dUTP pyrophosphatase